MLDVDIFLFKNYLSHNCGYYTYDLYINNFMVLPDSVFFQLLIYNVKNNVVIDDEVIDTLGVSDTLILNMPYNTRHELGTQWISLDTFPYCSDSRFDYQLRIHGNTSSYDSNYYCKYNWDWNGTTSSQFVTFRSIDTLVCELVDTATTPVKFSVYDGSNPVAGASVSLDTSKIIITNENGIAEFKKVRRGDEIPYTITPPGYRELNGTISNRDRFYLSVSVRTFINF